jgi:hypothetical protein
MAEFTLKITLGNDAMQTSGDIERAIRRSITYCNMTPGLEGNIRDINGNTVGSWRVK